MFCFLLLLFYLFFISALFHQHSFNFLVLLAFFLFILVGLFFSLFEFLETGDFLGEFLEFLVLAGEDAEGVREGVYQLIQS